MFDVQQVRRQFPALQQVVVAGKPAVFFDGPAGSQVPQCVIDAIGRYYVQSNANHGGCFQTSRHSDEILDEAHQAAADFVNAPAADLVAFGANMTSLTFALSRSLSRTWRHGDEVMVTRLDHDANVTPWVLAAQDAGAKVLHVAVNEADCTLNLADFQAKLSPRTRLVAVGCASNAVGTVNPVGEMVKMAHEVGAKVFLDAVHYAPHALPDVQAWDCDFLACSAYKFFGPHIGVLYGKREWLESLPIYKLRPAPAELPGRWETGTQNHECLAGVLAAIDYLASLGRSKENPTASRRTALEQAYRLIGDYEAGLLQHLMEGLAKLPDIKVWGITNPAQFSQRLPTISVTHRSQTPEQLSRRLAEAGIFTWAGNFYALPLTEALHLEPTGLLRIGLLHYNTVEEIDRLLAVLSA